MKGCCGGGLDLPWPLASPGCQSNLGYPVVVCINECFSSSGTRGCFATGVYKRPQGKAQHGLRLLTLYDTLPLHLSSWGRWSSASCQAQVAKATWATRSVL